MILKNFYIIYFFCLINSISNAAQVYVHELNINNKLLFDAINIGDINFVAKLLKENPIYIDCVNERHETPIMFAIKQKKFEIVSLLLEKNPDIYVQDHKGNTFSGVLIEQLQEIKKYNEMKKAWASPKKNKRKIAAKELANKSCVIL